MDFTIIFIRMLYYGLVFLKIYVIRKKFEVLFKIYEYYVVKIFVVYVSNINNINNNNKIRFYEKFI